MRLKFDNARASHTIQAPERVFLLDEPAHAIVSRCDGKASIESIVDQLCRLYEAAPRQEIETDVLGVVQDLVDKGVMVL
jgi:pyrroloquinoline quinone biosynthesis protein D